MGGALLGQQGIQHGLGLRVPQEPFPIRTHGPLLGEGPVWGCANIFPSVSGERWPVKAEALGPGGTWPCFCSFVTVHTQSPGACRLLAVLVGSASGAQKGLRTLTSSLLA